MNNKKFFPKNSKLPATKDNTPARVTKKRNKDKIQNKCTSLKEEFDLIMINHYSNISEDNRKRIWHTIGTQLVNKLIDNSSLIRLIAEHI